MTASGVLMYLFAVYSNQTLARFGFPRAWAGTPFLLGAAFCGITGGFLLVQRRFSLSGLLAAGVAASLVAGLAQAYMNSIHTIETEKFIVYVAWKPNDELLPRVRQ